VRADFLHGAPWATVLVAAAVITGCSACGGGRQAVRVGVLTDCQGGLSFLYQATLSGAELPLLERGAKLLGDQPSDGVAGITVAGRRVKLLLGCAGSLFVGRR
jgi:hypothetical protein